MTDKRGHFALNLDGGRGTHGGLLVKAVDLRKLLERELKGCHHDDSAGKHNGIRPPKPKFCDCGKPVSNSTGWRYQDKHLCNRCGHKLVHSMLSALPFIMKLYCAECQTLFRGIHGKKFGGRRIRFCSTRCSHTFRKRTYRHAVSSANNS